MGNGGTPQAAQRQMRPIVGRAERRSSTIGFVGLGSMGSAMALNLLNAGFDVRGYDIREVARPALEAAGGTWSATPRALSADILIIMVVNAGQAADVLFVQGALDAMPAGGVCILMSTCPPEEVRALADRVAETGRTLVDAPVSGGAAGAKAGSLTIMAATDVATFARVRPIFDAVGEKVFRVGDEPGQGAMVKAVNQLLCGVHLAAAAEAVALGTRAGVDAGTLIEILGGSAASSWMLRDRGRRMIGAEEGVTSTVDIFVKDLGIVLEAGSGAKAPLPIAAAAHQVFLAVSGQGKGVLDDSQVILAYRKMTEA